MRWTIRGVISPTQRKQVDTGRARRRPRRNTPPMEAGGDEPSARPTRKVMPRKTSSSSPKDLGQCTALEARSCGSTATCTSKPRTTSRTRAQGRVRESKSSTAPWCSEPNVNRPSPLERRGTVSDLAPTVLRKTSAHPRSRREDAGRGVTRRRSVPLRKNGKSTPLFRALAKVSVVCLRVICCILLLANGDTPVTKY